MLHGKLQSVPKYKDNIYFSVVDAVLQECIAQHVVKDTSLMATKARVTSAENSSNLKSALRAYSLTVALVLARPDSNINVSPFTALFNTHLFTHPRLDSSQNNEIILARRPLQ